MKPSLGLFGLLVGCGSPDHPPELSGGTWNPGIGGSGPSPIICTQASGPCFVPKKCANVGGTCCEGNPTDPNDAGTPDASWAYIDSDGAACVSYGQSTRKKACVPCVDGTCPVDAGDWQFSGLQPESGTITVSQCVAGSGPPPSSLTDIDCSGHPGPAVPGYQEPPFSWSWSLHNGMVSIKFDYGGGFFEPCSLVSPGGPQCDWSDHPWPSAGAFDFQYNPDNDVVYIAFNVDGWQIGRAHV
jgi:hypothetical protein